MSDESKDPIENEINQMLMEIREKAKYLPLSVLTKMNMIIAEQIYKKAKEVGDE